MNPTAGLITLLTESPHKTEGQATEDQKPKPKSPNFLNWAFRNLRGRFKTPSAGILRTTRSEQNGELIF